uniref:Putative homing endonuclease n=1 Tax=viral metagenome TaxID=1070528 RepID=A0A6M3IY00_9ZZZZ
MKIQYKCKYCRKIAYDRPSHYKRKKRHFCSMLCYSKFRRERLPFYEQHAYKGIRKKGQTKQVYHQNYCYKHPKRIAHLKSRRYAREQGAVGFHILEDWNNLKVEFDNRCAFCRKKTKLTKDHIIPLSEGGTDWIENIQPLCKSCNSKKWKHIYENPELLSQKGGE